VRAYPALVDEGTSVGVAVLESPDAQRESMLAGTRRLLLISAPSPQRHLRERLDGSAQLALATAPGGDATAVAADAVDAAADALIAEAGGPAWDEAGFDRLRGHVVGELHERAFAVVQQAARVLDLRREVLRRLDALTAPAVQEARSDIAAQLSGLVYPGFVSEVGAARLADVERYLEAMLRRLDRLANAPGPDRDRMRVVHELEDLYRERLEEWPPDRPLEPPLSEVGWMLEELRVSQFAQGLGVRGPVSAKRIRQALTRSAR
jgi:ATP-dependent helicase HrpA